MLTLILSLSAWIPAPDGAPDVPARHPATLLLPSVVTVSSLGQLEFEEEEGAPLLRPSVAIPAGAAALFTLGAYYFQVNARKQLLEIVDQQFQSERQLREYIGSIKTQELVSFAFMGAAAASAGYAAFEHFRPRRPPTRPQVVPAAGPGGASLHLVGKFE